MKEQNFASPLPYPPLDGIHPNSRDLYRIRNNYSGLTSELSAITQYVYHQLNAKEEGFQHIGSTLLSIAQVEMRHLNIFGSIILRLGGDPRFLYQEGRNLVYWNGGLIDHCRQLPQMLLQDIALEEETITCYLHQAETTCQPQLAAVLRRIVEDEKIHVEVLRSLLPQIP